MRLINYNSGERMPARRFRLEIGWVGLKKPLIKAYDYSFPIEAIRWDVNLLFLHVVYVIVRLKKA